MDHIVINLKDIYISTIVFRINPAYHAAEDQIDITTSVEVSYQHKRNDLTVAIKATIDNLDKAPFIFEVEAIGAFYVESSPSEEVIERIANINCAAIVFPYIRETIADLTRRAGFPPLHLQPINFVKKYEESTDQVQPKKRKSSKQRA